MPKKKNIWSIINLVLGIVSLATSAVAAYVDNETMKQEVIEEVTKSITNKEA